MIHAYRTIEVPVTVDGRQILIEIPLNIKLLIRLEEATEKANESKSWLNFRKGRSILNAFMTFAEPYLPESLDREKLQPAFYTLFFSHVREALLDSLDESTNSTTSTDKSPEPTEANREAASPLASPRDS